MWNERLRRQADSESDWKLPGFENEIGWGGEAVNVSYC
jgi:hypothetical protein